MHWLNSAKGHSSVAVGLSVSLNCMGVVADTQQGDTQTVLEKQAHWERMNPHVAGC